MEFPAGRLKIKDLSCNSQLRKPENVIKYQFKFSVADPKNQLHLHFNDINES